MTKGYLEDLLQVFASKLNFTLRQFTRTDRRWTPQDPVTKEFGGMVKNLRLGQADFIGANLVFTAKRFQILDFMQPISFVTSGFVVKRQKEDAFGWEVFTSPFHSQIWLFLTILSVVSAIILYIMHRYPKVSLHVRWCFSVNGTVNELLYNK